MTWWTVTAGLAGNIALANGTLFLPLVTGPIEEFDTHTGRAGVTHDIGGAGVVRVSLIATTDSLIVLSIDEHGYRVQAFDPGIVAEPVSTWTIEDANAAGIDVLAVPQFSEDRLFVATYDGLVWVVE
jgi:hypothetical protein